MKEMQDSTGLSATAIKKILKANGKTSFNAKQKTELRAIVLAHIALQQSIGEKLSVTLPVPEETQCPLPTCEGTKQPVRSHGLGVGKWRCSIGGPRHWIVWRTAMSMSLQFEKPIEHYMTYLLEVENDPSREKS
jgi:hypothetical protein